MGLSEEQKAENMLATLDRDTKIRLLSQVYGFRSMPPSIEEFIEDEYYIGSTYGHVDGVPVLYPFWKERLKEIYPNPIMSPYKYLVIGGAIGIGKSVCSKIMAAYDICKMAHLEDPYKTFRLDRTTGFTVRCFNISKDKANDVLIGPLNELMAFSPFFKEFQNKVRESYKNLNQNQPIQDDSILKVKVLPAKQAKDVISECMIFSLISEVNFFKPEVAQAIIDECITRTKTRLAEVDGVFGHIVLDSSSTGKDSIVEKFVQSTMKEQSDISKIIKAAVWEAKAHTGKFFNKGEFYVYLGDSNTKPHIIEKGERTSDFDKDRILRCPNELLPEFRMSIVKALNDLAGISLDFSSQFFQDKDLLKECGCIESNIDDEICLDFFDDTELYDIIGNQVLKLLPEDRKVYCRTDLGLVNDRCGMAIGYIDSARYEMIEGRKVYRPDIRVPIAFGLTRPRGQETNIDKVLNFWIWLATKRSIGMLSVDQYQSRYINQQATLNKINNKYLSVDKTDTAYVNWKNHMLLHKIQYSNNQILFNELSNLIRINANKLDHPISSSKDIADAVAGVIQTIIDDGIQSADVPEVKLAQNFNSALKNLAMTSRRKALLARMRM